MLKHTPKRDASSKSCKANRRNSTVKCKTTTLLPHIMRISKYRHRRREFLVPFTGSLLHPGAHVPANLVVPRLWLETSMIILWELGRTQILGSGPVSCKDGKQSTSLLAPLMILITLGSNHFLDATPVSGMQWSLGTIVQEVRV